MITRPSQDQQIQLSHLKKHLGDQSNDTQQDVSCLASSEIASERKQVPKFSNHDFIIKSNQDEINIHRQDNNIINSDQKNNENNDSNNKNKQQLKNNETLPLSSSKGNSTTSSLNLSGIELIPSNNKFLQFLQNFCFLVCLFLFGPLLAWYAIIKYKILKSIPKKLKIKVFLYLTMKACVISFSTWVMIANQVMDTELSPNSIYYKCEQGINLNTILLLTIGGAILGKSALFNNKFFSEMYYLSELEYKKASSSSKNKSSGILKSVGCSPQIEIIHPLDLEESIEIFECLKKERKIQERMTKVMRQLFIDSLTFTFQLLPFSLENPLVETVKVPCMELSQKKKEVQQKEDENENRQIVYECSQVASKSTKIFRRLQTIKFQEINANLNDQNNIEEQQQQPQNNEVKINGRKLCSELLLFCEKQESFKPKYFKKFIFVLFIALKGFIPCLFKYYDGLGFYGNKIFVGITFQLSRQIVYGVLIGFLLFSIDLDIMNSFIILTNKLLDYTHYLDEQPKKDPQINSNNPNHEDSPVSISKKQRSNNIRNKNVSIALSINLDAQPNNLFPEQNNYLQNKNQIKINNYLDVSQEKISQNYGINNIIDTNKKNNNSETQHESNDQQYKNINQNIKNEENHSIYQQEFDNEQNQKNTTQKKCCSKNNKNNGEKCECCEPKNSFNFEDEDIFGHSTHTPSIDFTDVNSLISWNNMRKLGFHYKQKDIVLIDRISIIFCIDLIIIFGVFLLNYLQVYNLGQGLNDVWMVIMFLLDIIIVIYTQLHRVHIQTQINKSFLLSIKALIKVQYFIQQSHLIDMKKHIMISKKKKKTEQKEDQIHQFFLKIKSKMIQREKQDVNYFTKIMKIVQFIQTDIQYDMNNDQLKFLGLIKATPTFEATLFTSVVGFIYWLFRLYMRYLNVDIGLLGQ